MTERENALLAMHHQEPEWVPAVFDCVYNCNDVIGDRPLFEDGDDCFGIHWIRSGPETNFITHVDPNRPPVLEDVTQWREQVKFPDLDQYDWEGEAALITPDIRREKLICYVMPLGIFERTHTLMRFEDALCAYLEEPEEMYELCGALADYKIDLVHHIAKYLKPDLICYHDDWAMQTGPFLPKHVWEEIIKPHTQRIYDTVKSYGINMVHHSCGKVESYIPDMLEMGIDGWNSCQSCNDLAGLKQRYGDRLVFWQALDDQRVLGQKGTTDEMLREEAIRKTEMLAAGGGWLCGPTAFVSFIPEQDRKCDCYVKEYSKEYYAKRRQAREG